MVSIAGGSLEKNVSVSRVGGGCDQRDSSSERGIPGSASKTWPSSEGCSNSGSRKSQSDRSLDNVNKYSHATKERSQPQVGMEDADGRIQATD